MVARERRVRTMTTVLAVAAVHVFAACCGSARGSVDEFQCECAYNARERVGKVRALMVSGASDRDVIGFVADYGPLVTRMLLVAHDCRGDAPTADWLWLLDVYANTAVPDGVDAATVADGATMLHAALDRYLAQCAAQNAGRRAAGRSQEAFEKYLLENVTTVVQSMANARPDDRKAGGADAQKRLPAPPPPLLESDFLPRALYLNDVAATDGGLDAVLVPGVGVDWGHAADRLRNVYRLARKKSVFGTRELVLFQKKFLSAVAASVMGHVLVHVAHCRNYWMDGPGAGRATDADAGPVGEYERVWTSIGDVLEEYRSYFDLGPEKYFRAMLKIAANPARDEWAFRRARSTIETNIANVGCGLFVPRTAVAIAAAAAAAATTKDTAGEANPIIGLIALVDNNISAAQTYLKTVRDLLADVDFRIVNDFMRSTYIWFT